MLVFNRSQLAVFVDKLPDAANLALAALVFGQFLDETMFSPLLALTGFGVSAFFLTLAVIIAGESES